MEDAVAITAATPWQAAAGVVYDSVPENEWRETEVKARALLRAAERVDEGLSHEH